MDDKKAIEEKQNKVTNELNSRIQTLQHEVDSFSKKQSEPGAETRVKELESAISAKEKHHEESVGNLSTRIAELEAELAKTKRDTEAD